MRPASYRESAEHPYWGWDLKRHLEGQRVTPRRTSAPVMWDEADPIGWWERLWDRNEGLALAITWAATLAWGMFVGAVLTLWWVA
jgi:hypothetical protein